MDIKSLPRALLFSMIVIAAISLNGSAPVTQPTMVLRHGDPGPVPSWVEMLADRKMADDGDTCDEIRELILKERKLLDQWKRRQAGSEAALAEFIRTSSARQVPGVHTDSALQYCLFWMRRDIVRGCIDLARQDMHSAERNPSEQAALYANRIGLGGHEKALCKRMKTDVADYDASLRLMVVNPYFPMHGDG